MRLSDVTTKSRGRGMHGRLDNTDTDTDTDTNSNADTGTYPSTESSVDC